MTARAALILGLVLSAAALLLAAIMPGDALRAWLAAAFLWSGLPLGSLGLMLVMRLTGGRWDQGLPPFLEAGALTLPIALAAFLPVLVGMAAIYPWAAASLPGFKGAWLSPLPFAARTLLLFAGSGMVLWGMVTRRWPALAVASAGLLFLFPMQTFTATDWLLSLEPEFHSSGFPLYAMACQFNLAFMSAAVLMLARQPERTAALAAIMITLTLIWLYLAFTQYIIIWSGDLAQVAGWYRERGRSGWDLVYGFCALVEAGAFLALVTPAVRRSGPRLRIVAGAVIAARVVEAAWLVLPQGGRPVAAGALALYFLAAVGLGLVFVPAQVLLLTRRVAARVPA